MSRLEPCHCGHPGAGCDCFQERRALGAAVDTEEPADRRTLVARWLFTQGTPERFWGTPSFAATREEAFVAADELLDQLDQLDRRHLVCACTGPWTQTVHASNAEGHQVGCPRWGIPQRRGDLFCPQRSEPHLPRRGSDVEAWLKAARDQYRRRQFPGMYEALDDLLDDYRLRADTGSTLDTPREGMGP